MVEPAHQPSPSLIRLMSFSTCLQDVGLPSPTARAGMRVASSHPPGGTSKRGVHAASASGTRAG